MTEHYRDLSKIHSIRNEMHRAVSEVEPKLHQLGQVLIDSEKVFTEVASELQALAHRADEAEARLADTEMKLKLSTQETETVREAARVLVTELTSERDSALAKVEELKALIEQTPVLE